MENLPSERQLVLAQRSYLAQLQLCRYLRMARQCNIVYFAKLFPQLNTHMSRRVVLNLNIHLEPWQRQKLLIQAHLSYILIKRLLKFGDRTIRIPYRFIRAVLSRYVSNNVKPNLIRMTTVEMYSNRLWSVAFHFKPSFLATSFTDSTVKLWRFSFDDSVATCVETLRMQAASIAFHPTLSLLATGSLKNTDGTVSGMTCVTMHDEHDGCVRCIVFHPTLPFLATGSDDNTAKLWRYSPNNLELGITCVATMAEHTDIIWSIAFHSSLPFLATGSHDNNAKLWRFSPDDSASCATCWATFAGLL
jgi:WD40 repeat protein